MDGEEYNAHPNRQPEAAIFGCVDPRGRRAGEEAASTGRIEANGAAPRTDNGCGEREGGSSPSESGSRREASVRAHGRRRIRPQSSAGTSGQVSRRALSRRSRMNPPLLRLRCATVAGDVRLRSSLPGAICLAARPPRNNGLRPRCGPAARGSARGRDAPFPSPPASVAAPARGRRPHGPGLRFARWRRPDSRECRRPVAAPHRGFERGNGLLKSLGRHQRSALSIQRFRRFGTRPEGRLESHDRGLGFRLLQKRESENELGSEVPRF